MNENIKQRLNKFGKEKEPFLFILSYDLQKAYIEKISSTKIKYRFHDKNRLSNIDKNSVYELKKYPQSFQEYKNKFDILKDNLDVNTISLANLTSKTKIEINCTLDEIYENSNALLNLRINTKDENFVCFSPEKFIEIIDNKLFTYPMKGTIKADIIDAKKKLLNSKKEAEEHKTVVELLKNDLELENSFSNIVLEEFRYIDKISTKNGDLLQTSSKISASCKDNYIENIGDIFSKLLPAGSITGMPKNISKDILEKIEDYDRGFYCGIFAIFDGKNLQSFVLIRFIEEINGEFFYKSGGGITKNSDAKQEYDELIEKVYLPF